MLRFGLGLGLGLQLGVGEIKCEGERVGLRVG